MPRFRFAAAASSVCLIAACGGSDTASIFGSKGTGGGAGGSLGTGATDAGASGASAASGGTAGSGGTSGETGGTGASQGDSGATSVPKDAGNSGSSLCQPGTFSGTLTGTYLTAATLLPASLPLSFTMAVFLTRSATAGFLDVDSTGSYTYLTEPFTVHMTGQIDCASGVLVKGLLTGQYGNGGIGSSTFQGPVTGNLDFQTGVLAGSWQVSEQNPKYGGSGTWRATS